MSQYFDEKDLFSGPSVQQYGSHMIMKNVKKETKVLYLNIDTKFRDEYNDNFDINYNITLPERINNLKSMYVTDMEIPLSYYVISDSLENNLFSISDGNTKYLLTIPDDDYDETSLVNKINTLLSSMTSTLLVNISVSIVDNKFVFNVSTNDTFTIDFSIDKNGCNTSTSIKSRLGWMLGFRKESYQLENSLTSESFIDLYGPKYLFLVVDDTNASSQNGFLSFLSQSRINKNILARICLERAKIGFNGVHTGDYTSDVREYNGKIDLQKIKVQLIDEFNRVMNLNGRDLSFCLRITYE